MTSLRTLIFGSRGLSADSLRARHAAIVDQLASAESLRAQATAALVELRAAAARAGLSGALQGLENPPAPRAVVRGVAAVRCRILQSFTADHEGIDWSGVPGDVFDLPDTLATRLAMGGVVERVDPRTALHQVNIRWSP